LTISQLDFLRKMETSRNSKLSGFSQDPLRYQQISFSNKS
jgi:hypothetical protein